MQNKLSFLSVLLYWGKRTLPVFCCLLLFCCSEALLVICFILSFAFIKLLFQGGLFFCKFIFAGQVFIGSELAFTVLLIHRELFSSASIILCFEQGELTLQAVTLASRCLLCCGGFNSGNLYLTFEGFKDYFFQSCFSPPDALASTTIMIAMRRASEDCAVGFLKFTATMSAVVNSVSLIMGGSG